MTKVDEHRYSLYFRLRTYQKNVNNFPRASLVIFKAFLDSTVF